MIPSLLEQVLAARVPTKQERASRDRVESRMERVREAVQRMGNVTVAEVATTTGYAERTCRETLIELARCGELISWKPAGSRAPRRWALAKPAPRVNKRKENEK